MTKDECAKEREAHEDALERVEEVYSFAVKRFPTSQMMLLRAQVRCIFWPASHRELGHDQCGGVLIFCGPVTITMFFLLLFLWICVELIVMKWHLFAVAFDCFCVVGGLVCISIVSCITHHVKKLPRRWSAPSSLTPTLPTPSRRICCTRYCHVLFASFMRDLFFRVSVCCVQSMLTFL